MPSHGQSTIETPEPPDFARGAQFVEYDEFIESQLRRTRSHVRGVDLAAGFMVLLTGTLAYFLLAALADHWLFSGGLGFWGRFILFAGFIAGAGWWLITQIVPLVVKRINPLYAAHTIERSRPTLKNSLVNFLLFRDDPSGVPQRVLEAIEEQAATNLVGVQLDSTVDRSRLIKLGYVLIGIIALCAIYAVASPKNLFQTIGRVVMPWADIQPPTQTTIDEIEPGDVQAFRGQQVTVKARVQGMADGSPVTLYYTTADRQIVDRPVEMSRIGGEYRHTVVLPAADAELQQSLTYTIKAGDATSRTYSVDVVAAPTIVVKSIEYKYPAYTGLVSQRVERQGDLKAIEGTEVTLEALANQEITSGYVDFDANHTLDLPLREEGANAKASFKLLLKEDRQTPENASYQLTFKNAAGQQNPQPVRHQIEVTRDLSPEVQFVSPSRDEIEVPINGAIDLEVVANDPDFALANVKLMMAKGKKHAEEKLLNEAWRGQFVKKYHFQPSKLKLAVGDTIEYWAVAVDNKSPRPNQSETARRKIVVVAPAETTNDDAQGANGGDQAAGGSEKGKPGDDPNKAGDKQAAGDESSPKSDPADQTGEQKPDAAKEVAGEPKAGEASQASNAAQDTAEKSPEQKPGQSEKPQAGEGEPGADGSEGASQAGNSGDAQAGEKPSASEQTDGGAPSAGEEGGKQQDSVASDGTNDGDAFERILRDREEQAKQQPQEGEKQQGGEQQQGEQEQGGEQQAGDKQGQQQAGDKQGGAGEQDNPQNGQQQSDKQQGGQKGGQEQQGEGQQQGGKQQSGQQAGGQKPDAKKSDAQKSGGAGESQLGEKAGGAQSDGAQGDGQQGQSAGEKSQGDKQMGTQGNKQPGDKQQGDAASDQKSDGQQAGQQGQGQQQGKSDPNAGANDDAQGNEKGGGGKESQQSDPNAKQSDTKGQGAQSKGDSNPGGKPQTPPAGEQRPDARGGDGETEKGESGAGQESEDKQGSPGAQESNQPRDKASQGKQQGGEKKDGEEQSPSISKRESDTKGDEDGDRSGGGKRGGGQKANQSGTGGAGQNTAADEGADRSQQAGGSETSGRAGEDQAADGKTGKSGQQQGPGSLQRPAGENGAPGGEQTQPSDGSKASGKQQARGGEGEATESADGTPSDQAGQQRASDSQQGEPSGEPGKGSDSAQAGGEQASAGGETRRDPSQSSQQEGVVNPDEDAEGVEAAAPNGQGAKSIVPPKREWEAGTDKADQANLEYTRKATDLAIEHLKDELNKGTADPKVLDKLGWTRQDAEKFVERWEAIRSGAKSADKAAPGGKRQLDEALRSLGLRPQGTALKGNAARDDRTQGLEESRRTKPPAEYSEAFKAYTQGTTRGGK